MGFVSPNELLQAAKDYELEGKEPITAHDWARVMAFFACNVDREVQPVALVLLAKIYDVPLTEDQVIKISDHFKHYQP